MASTLVHILSLGGIWGGCLLWQGDGAPLSGNNQMNALAIELVYEDERGEPVCDEKAPNTPPGEKTCADSASQSVIKTRSSNQSTQESCLAESTENSFGEAKNTVIVTASPENQKPPYPLQAREESIEGTVHLRLTIGPSGQVLKATPLEPHAHPLLEKSTLETVTQHTYIISGLPRIIVVDRSFEFLLES